MEGYIGVGWRAIWELDGGLYRSWMEGYIGVGWRAL